MFGWGTKRKLEDAWRQIEGEPQAARAVFETIAATSDKAVTSARARQKEPKAGDVEQAARAWLGLALCEIRLGHLNSAGTTVERACKVRDLTADELTLICQTWLNEAPRPVPSDAVKTFGRFLALPADRQPQALAKDIQSACQEVLSLPDRPDDQQVREAIRIGTQILNLAPDADWVAFLMGVAYYHCRQWKESVELLKRAVTAQPQNAERLGWLGLAYWQTDKRVLARRCLLEAYRLQPLARSAYQAGKACIQTVDDPFTEKDPADVTTREPAEYGLQLLVEATELEPDWPDGWLGRAEGEYLATRHAHAVKSVQRAISLRADDAQAYCLLGKIQLAQGDRSAARQALQSASQLNPNLAEVSVLAGDLAYEDGDLAAALTQYRRVPKSARGVVELRRRLARCELEVGSPAAVVEVLHEDDRVHPDLRLLWGRSLARTGRWAAALESLQTPDPAAMPADYRYYLGTALAGNQQYDAARELLTALCTEDGWRHQARRQLGHIAVQMRDFKAAEQFYVGERNSEVTHTDLGLLLLHRGQPESASRHFEKSVESERKHNRPASVARLGFAFSQALNGEGGPAQELLDHPEWGPWAQECLGHVAFANRNLTDALAAYEQATQNRERVGTRLLARLAEGYLQQSRYHEALPHLVELSRRRPEMKSIQLNLAFCRYQLGRQAFRRQQWETARSEWRRARLQLEPLDGGQAATIGTSELEAAWRSCREVLLKERWGELPRIAELLKEGCDRAPNEGRWWLLAGFSAAFQDNHKQAAECFARATELLPDVSASHLGHGLSLQAAARGETARSAFRRVLELVSKSETPETQLLSVATRFSLAMSEAADKHWEQAAQELEPLFGHPLIKQSSRISDADIAQAVVAYYGLAGQKDRAGQVAKKYLAAGGGLGDVLIGLVQVESGDYAGAAENLAKAYAQERHPSVKQVLIGCLLSVAGKRVLEDDLDGADAVCDRVLKVDAGNKTGKKLKDAIAFARRLTKMDAQHVDEAITTCEQLSQSAKSPQLVRMLAVLYHRRAVESERRSGSAEQAWKKCIGYWKGPVLQDEAFWQQFLEDYNAGKGRREQLKGEDIDTFRRDMRPRMATVHADFAAAAFNDGQHSVGSRHLPLIWEWDSNFKLQPEVMMAIAKSIDASRIDDLRKLIKLISDPDVKKQLSQLLGNILYNKCGEALGEGVAIIQRSGGSLGPWEYSQFKDTLKRAKTLIDEARKVAPDDNDIKEMHDVVHNACRQHSVW